MSRIVFISPYRDLSLLAQSVAEELGIPVEFHEGSMEEAEAVIKRLKGRPPDVFISRGGTASYIADHSDVPVISVNTGPFDLLECIDEARKHSGSIAVTSFAQPFIGLTLLEKVMNVSITPTTFRSLAELEAKIMALSEAGNYCVIGGGPSVRYATRHSLPSVFLHTSRETIRDALVRARELAQLRREEKRHTFRLNAILDSVYDGIMAVDKDGQVDLYNKAAARILGLNPAAVLGQKAVEAIPNTRLDEVLKSGQTEIGDIQYVGDVRIVTNRVPVKDGQEVIGAVATFQDISGVMQAERRVRKELTGSRFAARFTFQNIVGNSPVMLERKRLAGSFAVSDLTVLLYGASGTGKELFAQSIHNASKRAAQPFVAVNCGALPPTLLESELFGYEEGAFTGARRKGKHGLFELAHTGTIFLDEIDALPVDLQGRLLRVLQEREVLRIGGENIIPVDIRIIAATNQEPSKLLAANRIRADLFYRLNVLYLELPPLTDRKEDIPLLCRYFLPPSAYQALEPLLGELMQYLMNYSWPGNIRELYNVMQRLTFFQKDYVPGAARELLQGIAPNILIESDGGATSKTLRSELALEERRRLIETLHATGSVEEAAKQLGIGKSTFWRKLKKWREESNPIFGS